MILPGSASQSLAAALARELDEPLAPVEYQRFADGEGMARAPFEADRVVVVAATTSDEAHVELLQLQDVAGEQADEVVTVLPYMGYGRQDEAFREGEPVSARAVARAVSTGTDRVVLVNPHEAAVADFFDVECTVVDAAPRLAEPLPADLADPLFLAPDASATDLAESVREAYGTGTTDHFEKHRDRDTGEVSMAPAETDVAGRDVVLVDDIVATGGTMSEAIAQLDDPAHTFVTCVHPVLAGSARTRLARAGVDGVWGTDTVEREVSAVSVAPTLAEFL
ncbi:ribose-phosphate diphosphokinase [Salinirubellus salinus]|uniref:Ribose-phosphate pyrophosphokinase n=1 Tax=Salinirubellus salinus TaxID=1364945 RepID=A0A9E7U740_9EURY|nr:ribose-phosphate diphosphokinase [Salinirubellus salinus]UWM53131.1 ribose-phosphate diphosphokinase [Salinirubellus salinus]